MNPKTAGSGGRGQSCSTSIPTRENGKISVLFFLSFHVFETFTLNGALNLFMSLFFGFLFFFSLSLSLSLSLLTSSSLSFFAVPITQTSQMAFSRNIFPYE